MFPATGEASAGASIPPSGECAAGRIRMGLNCLDAVKEKVRKSQAQKRAVMTTAGGGCQQLEIRFAHHKPRTNATNKQGLGGRTGRPPSNPI